MKDSVSRIESQIEVVPWGQLAHAYDFAVDAPQMLARFTQASLEDCDDGLAEAVGWVWGSILHQGSVYSASVPSVSILLALLAVEPNHPAGTEIVAFVDTIAESFSFQRIESGAQDPSSLEPPVLDGSAPLFEAWVGPGVSSIEQDRDRYFAATHVRREVLVRLLKGALPVLAGLLDNGDPGMRTRTAGALCRVATEVLELAHDEALTGLPDILGDERFSPGAWISVAMATSQPRTDLFCHSDRRLRLAAAMSPAVSCDSQALEELVQAVNDVEFLEASFPDGAPTLQGHLRFSVLQALLQRVEARKVEPHVIDAICNQLAKRAEMYTVDLEWGPVVQWVFAERQVQLPIDDSEMEALPTELTYAQRSVLETLAAIDGLWDPKFGTGSLAFRRVQMPYDRRVIERLLRPKRRRRLWSLGL